ncbi:MULTISPECIES: class I SAM-dependent methyltransferase [Staphylococcus]|uniref:class I SAM-dependent methyltransferase n=1 Tax=Staphylococcus TaxID=1279 RepID=UPI0002FB5398|nr:MULTISPECIES: class I SAM-dependent methyltransferase [Staphylococcus]MBM6507618.1 methyltransferase domain-containing protein [Staphylococcus pasteuri]PTU83591.1 class I SAM-dependent methyltransferase [Staphylococcus pasteuri]QQT20639.1 methyltransferase domain-containing protein [Staphylococcus pasteuri]RIO36661.1 class I SAM-dependent methyltransferase [Staphylococcus pasteuri]RIO41448.1 class I SAM-dependent methyltransferase [Staphylococcus pasteuri]
MKGCLIYGKKVAGHTFLAQLGKKRLRPGGILATNWLIDKGCFSNDKRVLEVACNMCTTSIELAQKYQCQIEAVDLNKAALQVGQQNVDKNDLNDYIHLTQANAMDLPFEDESFDIILNEAMLTMLPYKVKEKVLKEYYRVLKPNGIVLTHDIAIINRDNEDVIVNELSKAINMKVTPLTLEIWYSLFKDAGFSQVESKIGPLSLMSPVGMLRDEGLLGTLKILKNALKKENRHMFITMFKTMRKHKSNMNYIVHAIKK